MLETCKAVRDVLRAQTHVEGLCAERAPGSLLAVVQAALQLLRMQARCILLQGIQCHKTFLLAASKERGKATFAM